MTVNAVGKICPKRTILNVCTAWEQGAQVTTHAHCSALRACARQLITPHVSFCVASECVIPTVPWFSRSRPLALHLVHNPARLVDVASMCTYLGPQRVWPLSSLALHPPFGPELL